MSNTLNTIQKLAKVGRILSKIVFIFAIIGAVGCLVGIVCLAAGLGSSVKIGGLTIRGLIEREGNVTVGTMYAAMASGLILTVCEAILARFAELYFQHELAAGTPFTLPGANEMKRLGILAICLPLGGAIAAGIVHGVIAALMKGVEDFSYRDAGSISLGIMFLVTSLILRYGTERMAEAGQKPAGSGM